MTSSEERIIWYRIYNRSNLSHVYSVTILPEDIFDNVAEDIISFTVNYNVPTQISGDLDDLWKMGKAMRKWEV